MGIKPLSSIPRLSRHEGTFFLKFQPLKSPAKENSAQKEEFFVVFFTEREESWNHRFISFVRKKLFRSQVKPKMHDVRIKLTHKVVNQRHFISFHFILLSWLFFYLPSDCLRLREMRSLVSICLPKDLVFGCRC